jgi:glutamate dehydrogenase
MSFASYHYVATRRDEDGFASMDPKVEHVLDDEQLQKLVSQTAVNEHHEMVMTAFRMFNNSILWVCRSVCANQRC